MRARGGSQAWHPHMLCINKSKAWIKLGEVDPVVQSMTPAGRRQGPEEPKGSCLALQAPHHSLSAAAIRARR